MPPRRKKASGLTEEDVARLRSQLDAGRRPRVALSGPQFETGASGSVVRIGDPAVDGADFLTVRVKVNGVADELAFAPGELSIGRGPAAGSARAGSARAGSARAGSARAGSARDGSPSGGTRTAKPAASNSPAAKPAASDSPAAKPPTPPPGEGGESPAAVPNAAATGPASSQAAGSATPAAAPATQSAPASQATAGRRRKAPTAPAISVTISSTGASWSVSASRGARSIAKGVPVAPGVVTAVAELLDQPALSEAVAEINETARLQAEQRAEQLRAELSDLEAMLATHRTPR